MEELRQIRSENNELKSQLLYLIQKSTDEQPPSIEERLSSIKSPHKLSKAEIEEKKLKNTREKDCKNTLKKLEFDYNFIC